MELPSVGEHDQSEDGRRKSYKLEGFRLLSIAVACTFCQWARRDGVLQFALVGGTHTMFFCLTPFLTNEGNYTIYLFPSSVQYETNFRWSECALLG